MSGRIVYVAGITFILLVLVAGYAVTAKQAEPVTPAHHLLTAKLSNSVRNSITEIDPQILSASATESIGGHSITFTNGGVSGGIAWQFGEIDMAGTTDYAYESSGGAPGSGRVYVTTSTGWYEFALPLTGPFTIDDVQSITVYAEAPVPYIAPHSTLGGIISSNSYAVTVVSSVFYQ